MSRTAARQEEVDSRSSILPTNRTTLTQRLLEWSRKYMQVETRSQVHEISSSKGDIMIRESKTGTMERTRKDLEMVRTADRSDPQRKAWRREMIFLSLPKTPHFSQSVMLQIRFPTQYNCSTTDTMRTECRQEEWESYLF